MKKNAGLFILIGFLIVCFFLAIWTVFFVGCSGGGNGTSLTPSSTVKGTLITTILWTPVTKDVTGADVTPAGYDVQCINTSTNSIEAYDAGTALELPLVKVIKAQGEFDCSVIPYSSTEFRGAELSNKVRVLHSGNDFYFKGPS